MMICRKNELEISGIRGEKESPSESVLKYGCMERHTNQFSTDMSSGL